MSLANDSFDRRNLRVENFLLVSQFSSALTFSLFEISLSSNASPQSLASKSYKYQDFEFGFGRLVTATALAGDVMHASVYGYFKRLVLLYDSRDSLRDDLLFPSLLHSQDHWRAGAEPTQ